MSPRATHECPQKNSAHSVLAGYRKHLYECVVYCIKIKNVLYRATYGDEPVWTHYRRNMKVCTKNVGGRRGGNP